MLTITGMDHIVLNVADGERSVTFYRDVLGLAIERLEEWRAGKVGFPSARVNEGTIIDLVQLREPAAPAGRVENLNHFCLVVGDDTLEPFMAQLASRGVPVEAGPARRSGARGDGVSIYLRDPDGNQIELRTYATRASAMLASASGAR
jgi:catechol 2,3-dioxygenase-like lactoylglutathione lyase family enzyme